MFVKRLKEKEIHLFSEAARRYRASLKGEGGSCFLSSFFIPIAVVGDLVSYKQENGIICGTVHGDWEYATIRVSNVRRFLDLRDFFTEDQLLRAFLANRQISTDIENSIADRQLDRIPATLNELTSFLTKFDYQKYGGDSYFEPDYLARFAFHRLEGESVCVQVSATSTSTAGRAVHNCLEICLPIPERLYDSLKSADAGSEGFLIKDSTRKIGTRSASFEFRF
ncbi:MAG: hypothetical protein IPM25_01875 [Chloracidobacterium sp.]|nr:hypothetical protein [Chloracidobacterium sp.]